MLPLPARLIRGRSRSKGLGQSPHSASHVCVPAATCPAIAVVRSSGLERACKGGVALGLQRSCRGIVMSLAVSQPSLGVSSLDLGRSSERPLFEQAITGGETRPGPSSGWSRVQAGLCLRGALCGAKLANLRITGAPNAYSRPPRPRPPITNPASRSPPASRKRSRSPMNGITP